MAQPVGRTVVRSDDHLCATEEWRCSQFYNEVLRPIRGDHELTSIAVLPDGKSFSCIGFGRRLGHPPFGRRERQAVHLFHTELIELWRTPIRENGDAATAALPPRQRQTLKLLQEGLSEKQVASRLGLSVHTVHDYVKSLHQRFSVCSTPELVAHTRVQRQFRPRMAAD
jgi:DNA-binding CsgD family transcriptional regulator